MRAAVIALAILLLASSAHAGPAARRMMAVMGRSVVYVPFTINGYSSISDAGVTDTGMDAISAGVGYVRVDAYCEADSGTPIVSTVTLEIDGVAVDSITCDGSGGPVSISETLSGAVGPTTYGVRVYGTTNSAFAAFSADNFRKPQP